MVRREQGGGKAGRRMSRRLHRAFLGAVAELVTCGVGGVVVEEWIVGEGAFGHSRDRFRCEGEDSDGAGEEEDALRKAAPPAHGEIISFVMKYHFPNLLRLLNGETSPPPSSSPTSPSSFGFEGNHRRTHPHPSLTTRIDLRRRRQGSSHGTRPRAPRRRPHQTHPGLHRARPPSEQQEEA